MAIKVFVKRYLYKVIIYNYLFYYSIGRNDLKDLNGSLPWTFVIGAPEAVLLYKRFRVKFLFHGTFTFHK